MVKNCTVPTDKVETLCPDPRLFHCCVFMLTVCHSEKEAKEIYERYNELCEMNKCPFLVEKSKMGVKK